MTPADRSSPSQPDHRLPEPLTRDDEIAGVAAQVRAAGLCALDLEFVSESRYVPELALVQVAWGDPEDPRVVAADPLAANVTPLVELVEDGAVEVVFHAAQGDLSLLADRFAAQGRAVFDSQIGAGFLGIGDQVGYIALISELLEVELDKGAQFTDWLRRPLSFEQLRYALDDVRYLLPAWVELRGRLEERERLGWVGEESQRLAEDAARRLAPEQAYTKVRGWNRLSRRQLGCLQALAEWRERQALESNTPPSWLLSKKALLELARRPPRDLKALERVRGVKGRVVERHGRQILQALEEGARRKPEPPERRPRLQEQGRTWASRIAGLVQARCREEDVAPRFVGTRADAEELVRWWMREDRDQEPDLPLLQGWRRELVGQEALDWLEGKVSLRLDEDSESGVKVVREE